MRSGSRRARIVSLGTRYLLLTVGAFVLVLPFVYMLSTSLKPRQLLMEYPPKLLPDEPTLDNYAQALGANNFGLYFVNSAVVSIATTVLTVLLAAMMAYSFAKFRYPGRGLLFGCVVLGLTIPTMLLIIPQFLLAKDLGLVNSVPGLIPFYVGTQLAFSTFLLRGFFEQIPHELDEAMTIDGAGPWRRFWNLGLPLAKPAVATCAIFTFLGSWDEFVWALTVLNDVGVRTLPVGLALFRGQHATNWGLVFAGSAIAVIPVIIVYIVFQRRIVSGLTSGALK